MMALDKADRQAVYEVIYNRLFTSKGGRLEAVVGLVNEAMESRYNEGVNDGIRLALELFARAAAEAREGVQEGPAHE
jgi:hypothetical protein